MSSLRTNLLSRHIDTGFYEVSEAEAKSLVPVRLPRIGWEMLVEYNGQPYWLTRTQVNSKQVWAIYWHSARPGQQIRRDYLAPRATIT